MTAGTTEHWIELSEGRLYARRWSPSKFEESGKAVIVLFHDSLGCVDLWRDFPSRLASTTGRTVVAYDRLGFGRSDPHPGQLSASFVGDEATRVVPQVLKALGLNAIVPFGHSVGGGMAVNTAASAPQCCQALVTVSAQTFVEDVTLTGIRAAERAFQEPGQLQRLERYHGAKARWVLDAWIGTWLSPEFEGWDLAPALKRVICPTLAIHGDRDEYGTTRHPERIASLTQGLSQALVLQGCGHVPQRERPDAVLDQVARFLAATTKH